MCGYAESCLGVRFCLKHVEDLKESGAASRSRQLSPHQFSDSVRCRRCLEDQKTIQLVRQGQRVVSTHEQPQPPRHAQLRCGAVTVASPSRCPTKAAPKQTSELGILATLNYSVLRNQPLSLCPAYLNSAPESSEMVTGRPVALVGDDAANNPDESRPSFVVR